MSRFTSRIMDSRGSSSLAGQAGFVLLMAIMVCAVGPNPARASQDKPPEAAPAKLPKAAPDKLPEAAKILDKYVEVTGGKAAYEKIKNRVTKLTFEMVSQGIKAPMTIYSAMPNKLYFLLESDALGKIEKGVSGDVAWEITMMMGPQVKEGQEKIDMLRDATFDAAVQWRKLYNKAECVALETIDGKPCYKIIMTPNEGKPRTFYYDQSSNLLVKVEAVAETMMGSIPLVSIPSDYKKVDGILMAHKTRVIVMGQERILTIESIEHNVEMPADRFELPDPIKELLKKDTPKKDDAPEKGDTPEKDDTPKKGDTPKAGE